MTSFENPKAIRHFQSICDSCQDLVTRFHTPSDLKLYSDGYLQALRNCSTLEQKDQEKLEKLIENKFDRILCSGSKINSEKGLKNLKYLNSLALDKITIMPGGGINTKNFKLFNL